MATLSLNSTGRSRITHGLFKASLDRSEALPKLTLEWDVTALGIAGRWSLFVDYWNEALEQRWDLAPQGISNGNAVLQLSEEFKGSVFRMRLVAVTRDSRGFPIIRAESVPVSFTTTGESSASSILPVQPDETLDTPWQLDFSGGDVILRVANKDQFMTEHLKSSSLFKPLIIGPVVFQIALKLLLGTDDIGPGLENWIQLLKREGLDLDSAGSLSPEEIYDEALEISLKFQQRVNLIEKLAVDLQGDES